MALYEVLEDGTIVPKAGGSNIYVKTDLEKEITITSGQPSIVIDDLVLSANEVYDIYILCSSSYASDMRLKINDVSSGYKYLIKQGYWYDGSSANMNTGGSTNSSSFKIGTAWTGTNSFHINLCNMGSYIAIESQETALDSTTNYIRDCSGVVSLSGNVTKLTFSLESGTFTSGRVLVYKRSKNKKPSMIYTGEELFAGNGINIENGVISASKSIEVLWERAGAPMGAETITLTSSDYDYLLLSYAYEVEGGYYPTGTVLLKKGQSARLWDTVLGYYSTLGDTIAVRSRAINYVNETTLNVLAGYAELWRNGSILHKSNTNYILVPLTILGVKL